MIAGAAADVVRELAPAKVNLVLHVGRKQANGLHAVCSLLATIDLADDLTVAPAARDEVVCRPSVAGPNLAASAVDAFRDAVSGELPPLRVEIEKRIPVGAGLAGGSADAAAVLRAANRLTRAPLTHDELRGIAAGLGSDVPSQVAPRDALVWGTGERVEPVALPAMALVLVTAEHGLSTGEVYAEADRIGSIREELDPEGMRALAKRPLEQLAPRMENDLEAATIALRPEVAGTRRALLDHAAMAARVSGSGPTVFGVFADRSAAAAAAADLDERALVVELRD
jgi:4-diphosphocytidyl-2-C-methyl-D-erythritol kinase